MELEFKKVETFEVKGILFSCVSTWNGMEEWKDAQGRKMIVSRDHEDRFYESFSDVFGTVSGNNVRPGRISVIKASPDLIALIKSLE